MDIERQKPKTIKMPKLRADFLVGCIRKLAAAANVTLSEGTYAVYVEQLVHIEDYILAKAVDTVIARWNEPSKMPPVAEVLNEANHLRLTSHQTAHEIAYQRLKARYDEEYSKRRD